MAKHRDTASPTLGFAGWAPLEFEKSKREMAEAARWTPDGVHSNFRAGGSPTPLVIERGEGPYLIDADGNRLVDYYLGMGPMILGHSPASVRAAVTKQLERGILYAGQADIEINAGKLFCELVPCAERVRFASSGTEAVQAAIRLARAVTDRRLIIKFEGHYHGWCDNILLSTAPPLDEAGPREAPLTVLRSRGQDPAAAGNTIVLRWNDIAQLENRLAARDVALVTMEPMMCNLGGILPLNGYLEAAREACTKYGTLLMFDETVTGFRLAVGGAQQRFGVTPDIATFGKAIASGFPVAAIAGPTEIIDHFSKGVVHGGTYNANPIAMAAVVATLTELAKPGFYETLERRGRRLMEGLARAFESANVPAVLSGVPQVFNVAFDVQSPPRDYRETTKVNKKKYIAFTTALLRRGVRALERGTWFISSAHDDAVIDVTISAAKEAAEEIKSV